MDVLLTDADVITMAADSGPARSMLVRDDRIVALPEPRVRVVRGTVLEGQDRGVLDDAAADLDGPPDGLI